jgi:hypothetical protein
MSKLCSGKTIVDGSRYIRLLTMAVPTASGSLSALPGGNRLGYSNVAYFISSMTIKVAVSLCIADWDDFILDP